MRTMVVLPAEAMGTDIDTFTVAVSDRYRIERELGRGGMATVYLAEDLKHRRKVALKVLRPELAASLGVERFLREIQIAAQLTHPNILPLFDSGRVGVSATAELLFYTMPYLTGESLRDRLNREKQLPIDEAVCIAREVAEALSYAHAQGVVHRDIKPENVLFQAGHAVVGDFGIAHAVSEAGGDRLTGTGLVVGTPAYMSPEQVGGDPDVDARSDIYALACVLYEMLAGDPPFVASTAQAMLARKATEPAPAISTVRKTVPEHVQAAMARALARAPGDRFATAKAFSDALGATAVREWTADRTALAVLPFANISADPENEYFSDGITEEVINALAGIRDLRVTARTSAFQFKGTDHDVREIGRRLGVGTILEGSVRKAGTRIRVTAQLTDAAGGYNLWSQRFDRDLEDVFAVQDEIARAIARRLEIDIAQASSTTTLSPVVPTVGPETASEPKTNPAAYDAYLRGRYHRRQMFSGGDAIERALIGYRDAIAIDADFAPAYSALAELHVVLAIGFASRPSRELMPAAKQAAERALALDPTLAEAHLARALVAMYDEWDYPAAKAGIERAIALNPSFVDAHFWAEFYYTYVERDMAQAVAANRRAADLDPLDLNITSRLTQVQIIFGQLDEAIARLEGILRMDPQHMVSHLELADAYGRRGDHEKALAAADRALELSGGRSAAAIGMAIAVAGDRARERLRALCERAEREYVPPFWLAVGHAAVGETDRAFEYLDQARRDRDPNLLYITAVPRVIGWGDDPRYEAVLRAIGLEHLVDGTRSRGA